MGREKIPAPVMNGPFDFAGKKYFFTISHEHMVEDVYDNMRHIDDTHEPPEETVSAHRVHVGRRKFSVLRIELYRPARFRKGTVRLGSLCFDQKTGKYCSFDGRLLSSLPKVDFDALADELKKQPAITQALETKGLRPAAPE